MAKKKGKGDIYEFYTSTMQKILASMARDWATDAKGDVDVEKTDKVLRYFYDIAAEYGVKESTTMSWLGDLTEDVLWDQYPKGAYRMPGKGQLNLDYESAAHWIACKLSVDRKLRYADVWKELKTVGISMRPKRRKMREGMGEAF